MFLSTPSPNGAEPLHLLDLPGYLRTGHATAAVADRILYDGVTPSVMLLHEPASSLMMDGPLTWAAVASCRDPRWQRRGGLVRIRPEVIQLDHATGLHVETAQPMPQTPTAAQLRRCYDGARMQVTLDNGVPHDLWLYPKAPESCLGPRGRLWPDELDVVSNQVRHALEWEPFPSFDDLNFDVDNKFEDLGKARARVDAEQLRSKGRARPR